MKNIVETTIFMLVMIYALYKGCVSKGLTMFSISQTNTDLKMDLHFNLRSYYAKRKGNSNQKFIVLFLKI